MSSGRTASRHSKVITCASYWRKVVLGVGVATYVAVAIEDEGVRLERPASAAVEGKHAQHSGTCNGEMSNGMMATGCR